MSNSKYFVGDKFMYSRNTESVEIINIEPFFFDNKQFSYQYEVKNKKGEIYFLIEGSLGYGWIKIND